MPPSREYCRRVVSVTPKGFRALQRKIEALEEQMHRGINLPVRDESKDEDGVKENAEVEAVINPQEERLFRAISKIGKDLSLKFPHFWKILTQRN